jgi:hypothetical protein
MHEAAKAKPTILSGRTASNPDTQESNSLEDGAEGNARKPDANEVAVLLILLV